MLPAEANIYPPQAQFYPVKYHRCCESARLILDTEVNLYYLLYPLNLQYLLVLPSAGAESTHICINAVTSATSQLASGA